MALTAIGLDDVKRLKNATGTTVNDVVLAVCTGALRSFLLDGDELPDKPLVAVVPVSVRPDIDSPKGSNQVSSMFVQLPADLDDPLDRLNAIHDGTNGAKEEHDALGTRHAAQLGRARHPELLRQRRPALHAECGWPTGTGPSPIWSSPTCPDRTSRSTWVARSSSAGFPLGPVMDGMGVNITIMSYRGVLYWGIMACPESIPRLWNLTAAIPLALDELLDAAGEDAGHLPIGRRPPPPSGRRVSRCSARRPLTRVWSTEAPGRGHRRVRARGDRHRRGTRAHGDGPAERLGPGLIGDHRVEAHPRRRHRYGPGPSTMSVGCCGARRRRARPMRCGSRTGAAGPENVATGTGLTQLLAESTTNSDDAVRR